MPTPKYIVEFYSDFSPPLGNQRTELYMQIVVLNISRAQYRIVVYQAT